MIELILVLGTDCDWLQVLQDLIEEANSWKGEKAVS